LVVRTIVNELLPEHASDFPKRGLGTGDAFEELYKQLNRVSGTHLLVFDEIDHLDDADTLLYELPRAKANGNIPDANVGVIGISNNYTFRNSLSAKVQDTLMETEISFSPYDAGELRTILTERAERALIDGAYDDSAIAKAAAIAAKDMGNARQAIDLLRVGAEVTERSNTDTVTDTQITEAQRIVQRGRLRNRISDQTQHAQYILEAMARLAQRDELPVRSRVVQTAYEEVAGSYGADPLTSLKSVQNHLSDLHMLGFLQREDRNQGEGGGRYYEYEMDLDPEVVLEAREEIEEAKRMS
jgi:orc1/cdc6 family replication initiation protein